MEGQAVLEREPGVIARQIAGETILVPTRRRAREMALFTLNEVGSFVWERLDGSASLTEIAEAVAEHFEVGADQATRDVRDFAGELSRSGCARAPAATAQEAR